MNWWSNLMADWPGTLLFYVLQAVVVILACVIYAALLVGTGFLVTQGVVWALRSANVIP